MIPKTTFLTTKETEAQYLIDIAIHIVNHFWQVKGFYLFPRNDSNFSSNEIYFPDLKYPKSFWDEAKRLSKQANRLDMPIAAKPEVIASVVNLITDPIPDTTKLQKKWKKVEAKFWQYCQEMFPDKFSKIKTFEIWVSNYQRCGSFNLATDSIKVWAHQDTTASDIAFCALSSLFRKQHLDNNYTWEESEAAIDHLMLFTKFNQLFSDWKPVLSTFKQKSKFAQESANYLAKLGFPSKPPIAIVDTKLMAQDKYLDKFLTQTEYEILRLLTIQNGSILNFETIGDIIWKEEACEKYSEWAIAKTIQRLREKIQSLGLTSELIQTKRGQGYYLLS